MHTLKTTKQGGFTLLELAIVLIIFGFAIAGLLSIYSLHTKQIRIEKVERTIKYARNALENFRISNSQYPCPARANLGPADPGYGVADCSITAVSGVIHGVIPNDINGFSGTKDFLQTGFIDPWGTRLNYAVTEALSKASTDPFNPKGGIISVVDEHDNPTGGVSDNAHFVVWSMGGDFDCTSGTLDEENCNGDTTFRDSLHYESSTQRYNDYITYYNLVNTTIWSDHLPGGIGQGDAKNNNGGNIGIGVTNPTERIEVDGSIALSAASVPRSYTDKICNNDGSVCMKPEQLLKIDCRAGYNGLAASETMRYIKSVSIDANGVVSATCENATFPPFTKFFFYPDGADAGTSCPRGVKYLITDGKVFCY